MNRILAALALVVVLPASAETRGALRLWVAPGVDTNARREPTPSADASASPPATDAALSAIGNAEGSYLGERFRVSGRYEVGARKFLHLQTEDQLTQAARIDATRALGHYLGVGISASAKDRRGASRDYDDLSAEAVVELVPDEAVQLKVHGGGHRFLFWNPFEYSFAATELGAEARYQFDRHHGGLLFAGLGQRRYPGEAHDSPLVGTSSAGPRRREDQVLTGGLGYSYRGPFTLQLTYSFTEHDSNSFGETTQLHRLSASAGMRLPLRLSLFAQGVVQLAHFPDGVYTSGQLNLVEDDDAHNALSLRLVRPLAEHLDLDLRYALYQDRLPQNQLSYLRQVVAVGLTFRL